MKKLLSLILAISMVLSLVCGASFASAETTETTTVETERVYNLLSYLDSSGDSIHSDHQIPLNTSLWSVSDYDTYETNFVYFDASADMETIMNGNDVKNASGTVIATNSDLINRLLRHSSSYFRFMTKKDSSALPDGQWFAMKLKTDNLKDGIYNVQFVTSGGKKYYTVYLAPYTGTDTDAALYMTGDNKIAYQQFENTDNEPFAMGQVKIDSAYEEYVIVIKQGASEEARINKIMLTLAEDEDFTNEFTGENGYTEDETKAFEEENPTTTVNVYTAVLGGNTGEAKANPVAVGDIFTTTADEKDTNGNVFRYWALGLTANKKVLTRERTLEVMATTDVKHVIAVYEPENAAATVTGESFYNANGQLLTDVSISDNKMPSLPSMAGYGTASVWVQYGTDKEFAAGADAPADNLMFVAKYVEPTTTYAITVENGTQSGNGSYAYGDEVTCTATVSDDKVFKCWTKTVGEDTRIISLDEKYTFNAWESCTLTAVLADEAPVFSGNTFSIILSEMTGTIDNNTAYMAEFVGLDAAVEKGVAIGTKRVAMTTDATQFTVVNDTTETEIKGYAILSDGTVIYDK